MSVHFEFEADFTGHALELPYDFDNLELAVGEAIWHYLMPDLLPREVRNIRVKITKMEMPDSPHSVLGVRLLPDGEIEVYGAEV